MKKTLQELIPQARQVISEVGMANASGEVSTLFKGYISSFGASIVQAGLLPTVIFFENDSETENKARKKVCQAIYLLIEREKTPNKPTPNVQNYEFNAYLLGKEDGQQRFENPRLLQKVVDYAIALKIALRTFKMVEK